ncbi:MAG: chloramphenicol acetyltransferase [Candidatus Marinimicrobia bacterium]|jgi:chloramphenicol O-acetyltransferase type A|nr:chloramphenicol acetyltransferase [Candidatus Neomarinimicrobiota bacterium]MBT3634568.1 chloramphenicol acetyltransferase [Candidatus Neomarinimicrobiota bacterium]MBT3683351.1 chloramphenicol acetyltransferase [Candidatus Neomarinimicrobiota bacterium]MBT3760222.1 chloramphenicol acetyltransferase [Candidatus Neomarinimicrobiota bacterium]MBT3896317.1 chloramphenicol acetyltransferase [Candidatus Neomarinimicrobiota bacterium]
MKNEINIDSWNRKEHFHFFSKFEEPFFGITAELDCTHAYKESKENDFSFYLYYLYLSLKAINETDEFKLRIDGNKVYRYDTINVSSTVLRDDRTFGFSFIYFHEDFNQFCCNAAKEIDHIKSTTGLQLNKNSSRLDTVHFSSIPWISFTGLTHARAFGKDDSVPKISIGKFKTVENKHYLPVSINCHHGLMDAIHVSDFLLKYGQYLSGRF